MDNTFRNRLRGRMTADPRRDAAPQAPGRAEPAPVAPCPSGLRLPPGWLLGLHIPVEPQQPCTLLMLRDHASDLSDALGGIVLDELAVDGRPEHRCWLYLDDDRVVRRLPPNPRLNRLAADLAWPRDGSGSWLGPALITGRDLAWADRDVPSVVVEAALAAVG